MTTTAPQYYVASQTYYGLKTVAEANVIIDREKANDAECIKLGLRTYTEPESHSVKGPMTREEAAKKMPWFNVMYERQPDDTLKIVETRWDSR